MLQKAKSVKMRALRSPRKFGVAGRSCQELLRKGCLRFQLPVRSSWLCLYEDGTELTEDYFPSIPDNTELVLLTSGQTWQGYVSDIGHFLSVFHEPHAEIIQAARQLLSDEQAPLRQKLLADLLHNVSQNIAAETRAEDPPWFEGLESRFRSKSSYLRYSCESRIRGYLRERAALCPAGGEEFFGRFVPSASIPHLGAPCPAMYLNFNFRGGRLDTVCAPWRSCYAEGTSGKGGAGPAWPGPPPPGFPPVACAGDPAVPPGPLQELSRMSNTHTAVAPPPCHHPAPADLWPLRGGRAQLVSSPAPAHGAGVGMSARAHGGEDALSLRSSSVQLRSKLAEVCGARQPCCR
ncbi:DNA fragmentation factor subunit beta isoform X1 [Eulemur rufifrons]|uniref:DNA fragmentation factor subunit beta isoform X1 n=1 Tax=Eulemur rufifrons TaxID=859984 RepID=UPI003742E866